MNTEEFTQTKFESKPTDYDAHEFDGLRDELSGVAESWLKRADAFVRENPWVCIALAVGIGCGAAIAMRRRGAEDAREGDAG